MPNSHPSNKGTIMEKKPTKPTPDFPLTARNNGQWAKKVKGRFHYFGPWADAQGALDRYNAWLAGEKPVAKSAPKNGPTNGKPDKPYKDFPLYAHSNGQWAKKVRGVTRLFGPWADWQAALDKWLAQKDDLLAGREPRVTGEGLTVVSLVNQFLESKELMKDAGELTERSFEDYDVTCGQIIDVFGRNRLVTDLRPDDFERLRTELAKGRGKKRRGCGPVTLSNDIGRVRVVFNYAYKQGLIDRPIVYGDGFKKPSRRTLRRERHKKGPKMFKAKEIRAMLRIASRQLKAMILLGINCGLGNNDCALLPLSALDLEKAWLDYPRPKTEVKRHACLWPETVKALREALEHRREPKDKAHADKVFITRALEPWLSKGKAKRDNPVSKETAKLLKELKIHRPGLGFYSLRHTFKTIGEECGDPIATEYVMGHAEDPDDMGEVYRERMTKKRLFKVANHVRKWLFNRKPSRKASSAAPASPAPAGE